MASESEAKLTILPFNLSRSKQKQSFVLERQLLEAVLPRSRPLLQSSLQLHEDADWREGAHVEDQFLVILFDHAVHV
jgi:hypothetical protein